MLPDLKVFAVALMAFSLAALVARSGGTEPKSFDDCILKNAATTKSPEALALVKAACKGKFPKVFDFDALAASAAVSTWREVAQKAEFSNLPDAEKSDARKQYFETVVVPRVDGAYLDDASAQFESFTRQVERAASSSAAASAPK